MRYTVPVGLEIEADGADVVVRFALEEGRSEMASVLDEQDEASFGDRLATATRAILSHIQDAAVTASSQPWPSNGPALPLPQAEVVNGRLYAWFGDRVAPTLSLEEIDTATLSVRL